MGSRLHSRLRFAPPRVDVEARPDGSTIVRSPQPLQPYARAVGEWLVRWASEAPDRPFLAERAGDGWRRITYRDALESVRRIGEALLARGLGASSPVAILSENSIDHGLLALGAMHAGVPIAPISAAYSLMSKDHAKLKAIFGLIEPGLVWAAEPEKYAAALTAVGRKSASMAELLQTQATARVEAALEKVGPD